MGQLERDYSVFFVGTSPGIYYFSASTYNYYPHIDTTEFHGKYHDEVLSHLVTMFWK